MLAAKRMSRSVDDLRSASLTYVGLMTFTVNTQSDGQFPERLRTGGYDPTRALIKDGARGRAGPSIDWISAPLPH